MPKRRVLDVGNCSVDHNSIKRLIQSNFDADVVQADGCEDSIERLRNEAFDLVLINRKLDHDNSDGIEILKSIKADERLRNTPVMLITNYTEYQDSALSLGAVRGFGKLEFTAPATIEKLSAILS